MSEGSKVALAIPRSSPPHRTIAIALRSTWRRVSPQPKVPEAFVKTIKRDYVRISPIPNARHMTATDYYRSSLAKCLQAARRSDIRRYPRLSISDTHR
jgi:hypothetical protein